MRQKAYIAMGAALAAIGLGGPSCAELPAFESDGSAVDGAGANKGTGTATGNGNNSGFFGQGGAGSGASGGPDSVTRVLGDGCAETDEAADLIPANLLFVVDSSGSMKCNAPPTDMVCANPVKVDADELSKWEITQNALTGDSGALQALAGQAGVSVGLVTFPTDDECAVPKEGALKVAIEKLDDDQLAAMKAGLSFSPDGKTPLAGAGIRGLEAMRQGIHAGELKGDNYLVIMTDGAETCQNGALDDLLAFVKEAETAYGIRTYAIGAPGSEGSRELLSEIAILGGTRASDSCKKTPGSASESCHIDLTESTMFESDLAEEFLGITQETTQTCEYNVPSGATVDLTKVNVEYTPGGGEKELVLQDPVQSGKAQCEGAEGWQFSEDSSQIVLCGQLCKDVLADPDAKVRVVFGCKDTVTVVR